MEGLQRFIDKHIKFTTTDGKEYVGTVDQFYSNGDNGGEGESVDVYLDNRPFMPKEFKAADIVSAEIILGK